MKRGAYGLGVAEYLSTKGGMKNQQPTKEEKPKAVKSEGKSKNSSNFKDLSSSWNGENLCPRAFHK